MNLGKVIAWFIAVGATLMHFGQFWTDERAAYYIAVAIFIWLISSDV